MKQDRVVLWLCALASPLLFVVSSGILADENLCGMPPPNLRVIYQLGDGSLLGHETDCGNDTAGTNTYLASPDDQTELTAIIAAAAQARIWVGVSDSTENTYAKTGGGTIPMNDTMWDASEPDNSPVGGGGGQGDCVSASMTSGKLADDACNTSYPAVCECEP